MSWEGKPLGWLEVSVICNGEIGEAVAEVMARFAENGVVIESITEFDQNAYEQVETDNVRVLCYLAKDENVEQKSLQLQESLWHLSQISPIAAPQLQTIQDEDWMASWKNNYKPIKVGKNWLILPAWIEPDPSETRQIIRIDPAMAFGTGTHPSTQLCLLAIEDYLKVGQDVIDLGCGSGILAIAALKLGASYALAVDTDDLAVEATKKNAIINKIHTNLASHRGSLDDILHGDYVIRQAPLVLANILAPVLIQLLKEGLARTITPGGKLVMAGILETQAESVIQASKTAGLNLVNQYQQDDWVALVFE